MDPKNLGFIKAGKVRNAVYESVETPKTVSEVAQEHFIPPSQVSRALKELLDRRIVKVLNPKARKGRLYVAAKKMSNFSVRGY
jgi:DNA-binding transcriptional regulator GbsR (MarR family)